MKLLIVTLLACCMTEISGHGRLISPPGRSTMWRYGYNTPRNTNDNQLSCGGFGVQYYRNGGKCGLCGDRWDGPRENEAGGLYATGTIAGIYKQGEIITIQIEITVNHGGWFEFRLCPNNNPEVKATEECLDSHLLELSSGGTQYQLSGGLGVFPINLKLPSDVTCSQCVLQWKWKTASNVHCQGSKCCRGCGPQEWFYGCADISIESSGNNPDVFHFGQNTPSGHIPFPFGDKTTKQTPINIGSFPDSFVPLNAGTNNGNALPHNIVTVPVDQTSRDCKAKPGLRFYDDMCRKLCAIGNCPTNWCNEACQSLNR